MDEGGVGDDVEVQTLPGSDEEDSVPTGPELAVQSGSSAGDDGGGPEVAAEAAANSLVFCNDVVAASSGLKQLVAAADDVMVDATSAQFVTPLDEPAIGGTQTTVRSGCSRSAANYAPLWGFTSICGRRSEMEDAVTVMPRLCKIPNDGGLMENVDHGHFFGVYDGHGGAQVANYCRQRMHLALIEEMQKVSKDLGSNATDDSLWEVAFTNCFTKVDEEVAGNTTESFIGNLDGIAYEDDNSIMPSEPIAPDTVGSTAVVAMISSSHIVIANCGDSRAVLCRGKQPLPLSVDHKPNREDEQTRIKAAGGTIFYWNGYRVSGVLAMSRSIGDRYLKPWIIPDPEVKIIPRTREDDCLILASDGLWDVLSNEEVCDYARKSILVWHKRNGSTSSAQRGESADPAAQAAADYLSRLALQRGSQDNVTVIVVDLKSQRKFKAKA